MKSKKSNNDKLASSDKNKAGKLILPCLRGRIGDWIYYSTLLPFKEVAMRVSMADEIHANKELSRWIQREIGDRIDDIVNYLEGQEQRFFNSLIVGIYGGKPAWQEINIDTDHLKISESESDYLDKTFGILRLNGSEKMFAIDGQHRAAAIKQALVSSPELGSDEVPVVFVAHRVGPEGEIRTRRLFSTLNRYAKPVSPSEIIALDEEDNAAILTRRLIEQYSVFDGKIALNKNKSLSLSNKKDFTNIILLYDIINYLLSDKSFIKSVQLNGYKHDGFISKRLSEEELNKNFEKLTKTFDEILSAIPFLKSFFENGDIDRKDRKTNLIFRPIGQVVFFNVYRIAQMHNKEQLILKYFAKDTFNLNHDVWKKVFIDPTTNNTVTTQEVQRIAILLLLMKFNIEQPLTLKDRSNIKNLSINIDDI